MKIKILNLYAVAYSTMLKSNGPRRGWVLVSPPAPKRSGAVINSVSRFGSKSDSEWVQMSLQRTCAPCVYYWCPVSEHPLSSKSPIQLSETNVFGRRWRKKSYFAYANARGILLRRDSRTNRSDMLHITLSVRPPLWGKTFSTRPQFFSHFSFCCRPWAIHLGPQNTKSS